MSSVETEERFAALVEEFAECPDVEVPDESKARRFGADALKVNGSIFTMVQAGRLAVKLPRERVDALVASGVGIPFSSGRGRPMKEWVTVAIGAEETWAALAREALQFVGSKSRHR